MTRIVILWIIGILLIVPWSIYRLLFQAGPEEYAFLIVVPLFWVFGFWGVVAPLRAAINVHRLMRMLDQVRDREQLRRVFETDGREAVIDLMARENRLPRFIAAWVLDRFQDRLAARSMTPERDNNVVE